MRQVAVDAWVEHSGMLNPGGQYAAGRAARRVLDDARELIASLLDADPVEVIFTGSGTEADNLAVTGLYRASDATRVVASPLEHSAVLKSVQRTAHRLPIRIRPRTRLHHQARKASLRTAPHKF